METSLAGYIWYTTTEDCDSKKVTKNSKDGLCNFTNEVFKKFNWVVCLLKTKNSEKEYHYSKIVKELKKKNCKKYLSYTTLSLEEDINQVNIFINTYNKEKNKNYSINNLKIKEA